MIWKRYGRWIPSVDPSVMEGIPQGAPQRNEDVVDALVGDVLESGNPCSDRLGGELVEGKAPKSRDEVESDSGLVIPESGTRRLFFDRHEPGFEGFFHGRDFLFHSGSEILGRIESSLGYLKKDRRSQALGVFEIGLRRFHL